MTDPTTATDDFTQLLNGFVEDPSAVSDTVPPRPEDGAAIKRALYEEYLKSEGYRYKVDEDGDISFRREGRWLVLFASDDDPQYFRLAMPNHWECADEKEVQQALETSNQMNRSFKAIKFLVNDGWVWASVEQFVDPLENFRKTFDRCADLLCEMAADFARRMRAARAAAESDGR